METGKSPRGDQETLRTPRTVDTEGGPELHDPHICTRKKDRAALRILEGLVEAQNRKRYPMIPEHARPRVRFNDQTTNDLTSAILEAFKVHGIFATRLDSKGTYNAGLGRFIPSRQRKGMPDVSALLAGRSLYVEVKCKATKDKIRPDQEATIAELRRSGARVCIAEDFQEFWEWLMAELLESHRDSSSPTKTVKN